MKSNKSDVLVFIPAFNEEENIGKVIDSFKKLEVDILVVDDGSSDFTADLSRKKGAFVLSHPKNLGYEAALSSGFEVACEKGYKYAVSFDADGQMNPNDVIYFKDIAEDLCSDLIVGIRSYRNRMSEHLLSKYGKFRFNIKDPLCGMKLYRMSSCRKLIPFDSRNLVGMEMAFKISDLNFKISEIPIKIKKRKGESRYGSSIRGEINIILSLYKSITYFGLFK